MSEACCGWARAQYAWDVAPERVRPLADVIAGLQAAIEHFSRPGPPVILPTPAYMPFLTVPPALGREVIQVPLATQDGRPVYDLDAIEAAYRGRRPAGALQPAQPDRPGARPRGDAGGRRGRGAARWAGVLRRDPRPAGVRRASARPLRDALRRRRAHRHRGVGVEGVEPARPQVRAAGAVQRGGRREAGRESASWPSTGRRSSASWPTRRLRVRRTWLADAVALPRRQPPAAGEAARRADPGDRLHAARGHLPRLAGLPGARPRRPPGRSSSSSTPASR